MVQPLVGHTGAVTCMADLGSGLLASGSYKPSAGLSFC